MSHGTGDQHVSPAMRKLSVYVAAALKRKLPGEVLERAKLHLVDTVAAIISGTRLLPGKRAIAYVKPYAGMREAGVFGTRIVTSALYAALANGTCAHADETDDSHLPSRCHPGAGVIPAVLAIAEREQLSGSAVLHALVLGYDVCPRLLLALKDEQLRGTGFHPSSKGGLFGAAAASAALLGFDARRIRHVFAYCAEQASGLTIMYRDSQHNEKAYVVGGMPAHNGVAAALMVESGFNGVDDVFSGEDSFLSVFSRDADARELIRGLGRDYEILRVGQKYWPVGAPIQAPLHTLRELMQQHGFAAADVQKLTVRVADKFLKVVDEREMPDISVQHLLAVMLLDGNVTFATAHDFRRIKDPRVLKLRRNHIEAVGDASLTDYPLRRWQCAMEIALKDGRKLSAETRSCKGSLGNPLSRAEVEEKALDLIEPVLGKKRSQALIWALFNIERVANVRRLRRLYVA